MIFAGKKEGFPIGYLTRPSEFSEIVSLIDPLLWVTGPSPFGPRSAETKKVGMRVWFLVLLSVFLCILCNLMGPATAVLVIPSLQWIKTKEVGSRMFTGLNAAGPPSNVSLSLDDNHLHTDIDFIVKRMKLLGSGSTLMIASIPISPLTNTHAP